MLFDTNDFKIKCILIMFTCRDQKIKQTFIHSKFLKNKCEASLVNSRFIILGTYIIKQNVFELIYKSNSMS